MYKIVDDFMVALSALPTCDASGAYPIKRPTDLDLYITTSRAYRMAKQYKVHNEHGFVWRMQCDANI